MALRVYDALISGRRPPRFITNTDTNLAANMQRAHERAKSVKVPWQMIVVVTTISKARIFAECLAISLAIVILLTPGPVLPSLVHGISASVLVSLLITGFYIAVTALALVITEERQSLLKLRGLKLLYFLWSVFGLTPLATALSLAALFIKSI